MQEEAATILDMLYVTDENLTADEIAATTDLATNDVEQALTVLEQSRLVQIGVKADSANYHDVTITEKGVKAVKDELPYSEEFKIRFDPVPGYWGSSGRA